MIVWINGAFGAGKTTIAHELHRRLPHSFLYDPENALQIDRCVNGLLHEVFQRHIDTDYMTIDNVVEQITNLSNLEPGHDI